MGSVRVMARNGPTWLYKLYAGTYLAYVGITRDLGQRLEQHRRTKEWYECIDRVESVLYPTWQEARDHETYILSTAVTVYNMAGNMWAGRV